MRIMHVVSAPAAGGAEVYVKDLAKRLVSQGNDVKIAFVGTAKDIGRSEDFEKQFLAELDEAGVGWEIIGNECRKKPWQGIRRIKNLVNKHRIDIYHSHLPFGVVFGAGLGCPRVYTHHTIEPRLNWLTYRIFNKLIDRYVGISRICAEKLGEYSGRGVTPILNGVDVGKFADMDGGTKVRNGKVNAISVGRIAPQKAYEFLIEAVSHLSPTVRSNIVINIAGEGQLKYTNQLKKYINDSDVSENFVFLGNRSDIPRIMENADLFLMSSEWEGLPISLIEATVSGLPCIVTDVGGCSEIIEKCRNGAVVPFGDVERYAREIQSCIENPEKLREWSANARTHRIELDITNAAKSHLDLYSELVGEHK